MSRKVRDYADYILANKDGKYSDKLIMLVKSMLNYGANAQTQFEHNTDALANAGVGYPLNSLNDNEINGIAGAVPEKDSIRALLADKGIAYHGYSLILNTKTTLRFYFKKDGADYTQLAAQVQTSEPCRSKTPTIAILRSGIFPHLNWEIAMS